MRLLAVLPSYPYAEFPFSGIFNERCIIELNKICERVEVLAPRPYVPPMLSSAKRWSIYSKIKNFETRDGINIHRPYVVQVPKLWPSLWVDYGAYIFCRRLAKKLYDRYRFDAIVSFDLLGAGGIAWRIGRELGIPTSGWATGSDVRVDKSSTLGKVVRNAINNLNLVFYQSSELLEEAARLVNVSASEMDSGKNIVLPRGIPHPPELPKEDIRKKVRSTWGIADDEVVILSLGRLTTKKGIFELLEAFLLASSLNRKTFLLLAGSMPAFDETIAVKKKIKTNPSLERSVRILPACKPDGIWELFCGADMFAFTSHKEGMPNSLLEAMASALPAIAFEIPAVRELDKKTNSLIKVQPFDIRSFAEAITKLASSHSDRKVIGERGRKHVLEHFQIQKNMTIAISKISKLANKKNEAVIVGS